MRLDWIEDILAVQETGSFARAADRRFVTHSAFTRRIRSIEDALGSKLFDRRRKPVELLPHVSALLPSLREAAQKLRLLQQGLGDPQARAGQRIALGCLHAISTTTTPRIVQRLTAQPGISVKVRSANRSECLMLLLSREIDVALVYGSGEDAIEADAQRAFEQRSIGQDWLVPVCASHAEPHLRQDLASGVLPIIGYPTDVFLGRVVSRNILDPLGHRLRIDTRVETALTLAGLQFTLEGIGVAWLPQSLVHSPLASGQLAELSDCLPSHPLEIQMIYLPGTPEFIVEAMTG